MLKVGFDGLKRRTDDVVSTVVKIKKNENKDTKFKVRCSRFLYTLVVSDSEKAEKLRNSLPPGGFGIRFMGIYVCNGVVLQVFKLRRSARRRASDELLVEGV